jgi:hypothetical protein
MPRRFLPAGRHVHHGIIELYGECRRADLSCARRCPFLGLDDGGLPDRERANCRHLQLVCTENLKSDHSGDEVRQGWRVI